MNVNKEGREDAKQFSTDTGTKQEDNIPESDEC